MSRPAQSKAQNDANARTLRALVKQPENKTCVDCKRNDPRWASWNLGCFLCIRCSGIHRSMGTHISKVKSIDLDIWTPEQMASVQKWGNRRANAYWEAHLKAGHVPPEHKIESFIRSKYETKRWAKEGPPPSDPSVLDQGGAAAAPAAAAPAAGAAPAAAASSSRPAPVIDLMSEPEPAAAPAPAAAAAPAARAAAAAPAAAPAKASGGGGGLFDLDWSEPAPSAASPTSPSLAAGGARGKNDILSLFSQARPAPPPQPAAAAPASSGGFDGLDAFGGLSMGAPAQAKPSAANPWAQPQAAAPSAPSGGGGFDVWGDMTSANKPATTQQPAAAGKDAFGDLAWGEWK